MTEEELEILDNEIMDNIDNHMRRMSKVDRLELIEMLQDSLSTREEENQ